MRALTHTQTPVMFSVCILAMAETPFFQQVTAKVLADRLMVRERGSWPFQKDSFITSSNHCFQSRWLSCLSVHTLINSTGSDLRFSFSQWILSLWSSTIWHHVEWLIVGISEEPSVFVFMVQYWIYRDWRMCFVIVLNFCGNCVFYW
jgi:hypothetical protein